jgi:hypothetical protein
MGLDTLLVNLGAALVVGFIIWYFRLFDRSR